MDAYAHVCVRISFDICEYFYEEYSCRHTSLRITTDHLSSRKLFIYRDIFQDCKMLDPVFCVYLIFLRTATLVKVKGNLCHVTIIEKRKRGPKSLGNKVSRCKVQIWNTGMDKFSRK